MKLIAISGWKKSGKDTAGELLINDYGFKRISFAGPLKDKVAQDFNMTRAEQDDQSLKEQPLMDYPVIPKDGFALNLVKFMYREFRDAKGRIPLDLHIDASGAVMGVMAYPNQINRGEELAQLYWTRRAMQILEGSGKRTVDSNYWVKQAIASIDNQTIIHATADMKATMEREKKVNNFVITDLRYKSEVEPLRAAFGKRLLTVRVNRFDSTESTDPSERDLDNYPFDVVIENKGTLEEFLAKVKSIL